MRNVDLGWVRVFAEVVRAGSLSEAARRLNLSQPAVSYQIRRVEEEFGQPLLLRQHRGIEPTEDGARLYDVLWRCVTQVDEIAARMRRCDQKSPLRLFTDYAFSGMRLIPRIHEFRDAYPHYDLQVVAAQKTDLAQLREGDTAVVFGATKDLGPDATLLMPDTVVPVCAPDYPIRDIKTAALIHLDSISPLLWSDWQSYLLSTGLETERGHLRETMRFNTYSLVVDAAVAGQGVALGWRGLVDPLLDRGVLVAFGPEFTVPGRGYHVVRSRPRSAANDALYQWLLSIHQVSHL